MLRLAIPTLLLVSSLSLAGEITAEVKPETIIFRDGEAIITEYHYAGKVKVEKGEGEKPLAKPYFWPLNAPGGTPVTRAWPMERGKAGETTDHFHQKSAWFGHGDVIPEGLELKTKVKGVKGVDFWAEGAGHGQIVCKDVAKPSKQDDGAVRVATTNEWRTPDDVSILRELRVLTVSDLETGYLITFDISFYAAYPITFGDTKEGAFGVRVPDEFRLATSGSKGVVTSSDGASAKAPAKDNLPMWGKIADWNDYSGEMKGKTVGIAIFADPKNKYASAWHTRAYGLMAANPFGREKSGFPALKSKTDLVTIPPTQLVGLGRFAIYTHTGDATTGKVAEAFKQFAK